MRDLQVVPGSARPSHEAVPAHGRTSCMMTARGGCVVHHCLLSRRHSLSEASGELHQTRKEHERQSSNCPGKQEAGRLPDTSYGAGATPTPNQTRTPREKESKASSPGEHGRELRHSTPARRTQQDLKGLTRGTTVSRDRVRAQGWCGPTTR